MLRFSSKQRRKNLDLDEIKKQHQNVLYYKTNLIFIQFLYFLILYQN